MLVEFCLPVKDEEKILEANVMRLFNFLINQRLMFSWRIIIAVNGSSDRSLEIAKRITESDPNYLAYSQIEAGGKGRALKKCFNDSRADILVFMDIDLSSALENLIDLINPVLNGKAAVSIGSRLIVGATTNRSFWREYASRLYNLFSRCLLNHNFHDLQCGFKAVKKETFQKIYPLLQNDAWFFDTELVILAQRLGYPVQEVAIDWRENRFGKHKSAVKIFRDSWRFIRDTFLFRRHLRQIMKHHDNESTPPVS